MKPGEEIALKIDHTLTQDSTGTLAYLEFEAMGIPKVKTQLSLSFVDHNMLQNDFRNADDHRYLQGVAAKYGIVFSRPGNGICHQLYLERFAKPGLTLLGSDSHTPTAGGMSMIAIGAGGLDVAAAMAGEPFYLEMPSILGVKLTGKLTPFVSAKDVILQVLKELNREGRSEQDSRILRPGVRNALSVPERGTITNMGTETGATTSIFPSDEATKAFLNGQGRANQWTELKADEGAEYRRNTRSEPCRSRTINRFASQPRQRQTSKRSRRNPSRPSLHRQLHQLIPPRPQNRLSTAQRQKNQRKRQPHNFRRFKTSN